MAVAFTKHNGDVRKAIDDFETHFANRLAPRQEIPSPNCFRYNAKKLYEHATVKDRVSIILKRSILNKHLGTKVYSNSIVCLAVKL